MAQVESHSLAGMAHANAVTEVVQSRSRFSIGGGWQPSTAIGLININVEAPTREETVAQDPAAGADPVNAAVSAMRSTPPGERAGHLRRLHQAFATREERIAKIIALEVG